MEYTIKLLADEIGVSKTAVRKRIANLELQTSLRKSGNRLLIPDSVAGLVKESFDSANSETKTETETQTETETENHGVSDSKSVPWEVYEDLRMQLAVKDGQIADLSAALVAAQESNKALSANAAMHTAADRRQDLALESAGQKEDRLTRWQRLRAAWKGAT